MLKAYQDYYALVQSDQVAVSEQTSDMLLEMLESKYAGITSAVQDVISVGQTLIEDADSADLDAIEAAVDAYNNLNADAKSMADSILSNSTLKFAATLSVPIVYDENTDALEAYNNRPEVSTYTGSDLLDQAIAYVNEAQLNDFVAYIDGLDLDAILSDNLYQASVINAIFDLYATLSHNTTDIEGLITLGEIC